MTRSVPSNGEVDAFLKQVHSGRERLLALVSAEGAASDGLFAAIDEISEQLLVADEELRVQNEQIVKSAERLDLLIATHEELFDSAPVAYVQSDADGVVLRVNRAARALLQVSRESVRSITVPALAQHQDRVTLRNHISALRASAGKGRGESPPPIEVRFGGAGCADVTAVVTVRRSLDGATGRPMLHWEIQQRTVAPSPVAATETLPFGHLASQIAEAASVLARQETRATTLESVVRQASAAVTSCDEVGISLIHGRGRIETPAATGNLAAACDQLQYDLKEGPCLQSITDTDLVHVVDMAADERWPRFAPAAHGLGVGSMLVIPMMAPRGMLGALNFYARDADAFDADDEIVARAYAAHAAIAVAHIDLETNLRAGLATREEIGRAVGILMERHRIGASDAFALLVQASQHGHVKLRDVAARVAETGEEPASFT